MKARGVVAAGHVATVDAAASVLRDGGNAFDAALAGMCAACVAEPVLASLGGGGFLLARTADDRCEVFDFFVQTPSRRLDPSALDFRAVSVDFGAVQQPFHFGLGSIATPGVVRGLFEVHRALGSMPIEALVQPAVQLAREGVLLNSFQAYVLQLVQSIYEATPEIRCLFRETVADDAATTGRILCMPDLGDTLEALAREGDDLFYRGELARGLVEMCRDGGGLLTAEDLARYRVERRQPLTVDYRGTQVRTNPPPATGGVLIAFALQLLQSVSGVGAMGPGSAAYLGLLARVLSLTNAARGGMPPDCDPAVQLLDPVLIERYRHEVLPLPPGTRGTTHLDVIDADGNVASLTLSNGEGSGFVIPGSGIVLNNMLGEDDLIPQGPHTWPENRRMTSMMSPTLVRFPDGRLVATGSGGSKRIRTSILQVLINLIDFELPVNEAVARPRIFVENDRLSVEGGFDVAELEPLLRTFPDHCVWGELNLYFGGAHTVELRDGQFHGTGDSRRGGVARIVR